VVPSELLPPAFFERDAREVAPLLIGVRLVVREGGQVRAGRIVETEAYCGPTDLACHARAGITKRTRTLYGPPGHAYVFLIYGMYDCFNVVVLGEGQGHAVLVRAIEPIAGVDPGASGAGPGRLTRALGITRADDGAPLTGGGRITLHPADRPARLARTARVGVAYAGVWADRRWRWLDKESAHVSRPPARSIGRVTARPRSAPSRP